MQGQASWIERRLLEPVRERLKQFPAVALLGPRQVGKTSLALELGGHEASVYLDLDARAVLAPDQTFVVIPAALRYPLSDGLEAIVLTELAGLLS